MKILILSDLHLEGCAFKPAPGLDFDTVVLAGDVHSPCRRAVQWANENFGDKPVIYVPGNHEFYRTRMDLALAEARAAAQLERLHLLDGDMAVIGGVRFLGATLWTDFTLALETPEGRCGDAAAHMKTANRLFIDYAMIWTTLRNDAGKPGLGARERFLTAEDTRALNLAQRAWLIAMLAQPFAGPTVVVTHHAPHRGSLAPRFASDWVSCAFVNELPDAFFDVPVLWIHGHTHESFDYQVRQCRVVCNPRGYVAPQRTPGNPDFDPRLIIEVKTPA